MNNKVDPNFQTIQNPANAEEQDLQLSMDDGQRNERSSLLKSEQITKIELQSDGSHDLDYEKFIAAREKKAMNYTKANTVKNFSKANTVFNETMEFDDRDQKGKM